MGKVRCIDSTFIGDLKEGVLSFFYKQVIDRRDDLSLEIRDRYISIYYRGGSLLKISQKKRGYSFYFNPKYCLNKNNNQNYSKIAKLKSADDYKNNFDLLISEMQSWLDSNPKAEREYQHELLINHPEIIDIEYAINKPKRMRLDMLMVVDDKLVIVENKFGTKAIGGKAGLSKHYKDVQELLNNNELRNVKNDLIASAKSIIKCKQELELLPSDIKISDNDFVELLVIISGYNENSKTLKNAVNMIGTTERTVPAKVLFAEKDKYKIDLEEAEDLFKNRYL